jgi:hypothetical protein
LSISGFNSTKSVEEKLFINLSNNLIKHLYDFESIFNKDYDNTERKTRIFDLDIKGREYFIEAYRVVKGSLGLTPIIIYSTTLYIIFIIYIFFF